MDVRIMHDGLPVAKRRLQQLILIIMEASESVTWDAVYNSILDPTNHQLCAGNTMTVRARILYGCINNDHPAYVVRVITSENNLPPPDNLKHYQLTLGDIEDGDVRMRITMSVMGLYERMHHVLISLSGGQRLQPNPDRRDMQVRPWQMIGPGPDERCRLAAAMLFTDALQCACAEATFSGYDKLSYGEEESRQLLFTRPSLDDTRTTIDLNVRVLLTLPTSRTDVLPHEPEDFTGYPYPLFAQLNLVLGETQPDLVDMLRNCIHHRPGWDREEITDAMVTDSGFILREIEENPVREDDRWPSVFKWLAYDGEGLDMTVV